MVCETGCGSLLNNMCDSVISYVMNDGNIKACLCHGCLTMMKTACRIAGFTVDDAPKPACTCWLTPLVENDS